MSFFHVRLYPISVNKITMKNIWNLCWRWCCKLCIVIKMYLHLSPALRVHWPSEHGPEWPERESHTTRTSMSEEAHPKSALYKRGEEDSNVMPCYVMKLQQTEKKFPRQTRQRTRTKMAKQKKKAQNSNWKWLSGTVLAVRGHVREDAEEEFSLSARLKGCGYDDVAPLCQVDPLEHGPGVDVDAPTDLLLGDVHAVDPVQLHLNTALFNVNVRLTADSATSHTL